MAAKPRKQNAEADSEDEHRHRPRPFWSGVIAFGLVSLPVSLFPATRGRPGGLSMVDDHGTRLRRQYFSEAQAQPLERKDIVRGYPEGKDRFLIVEDEELEALAPDKSREIDLQRFVPLDDINPVYFERGYFLAPDSDANKAYRLLAKALQEEQKAGIATFVMRDREYLIAIMSESGILRAETLRFEAEIRTPGEVGLDDTLKETDPREVRRMRQAMKRRSRKTLQPELLVEQQRRALQKLVKRKLHKNEDVLTPEPAETSAPEDDNIVDLMQVLKDRLRSSSDSEEKRPAAPDTHISEADMTRSELYGQAQEKGISGRSKMNKQQLAEAIRKAG